MRIHHCLSPIALLFLHSTAAFVQATDHPRELTHADLRNFAQEELRNVRFTKPSFRIVREKLLEWDFGNVEATASQELVLQLRVELLRKHPLFGEELTGQAIAKLESIINRYMEGRAR